MTQTFNNQVMFGHREWSILADNNTPLPVGSDNQPLVDKPLITKQRERVPSEVGNVEEDSGIVGYMGDDEDIEQAKYDVMSLITDKIGGLDNRLERINQELSVLIGSNERDIKELRSEVVSEECTPFLISKCDKEKTYEGCSACANYWRGKRQLPENCNETGIHNHCSYHNTYITQSSPGVDVVIGSPGTENESIKVGTTIKPDFECDKLGHFDCQQIIKENTEKYQNDKDNICLWDDTRPLSQGFNYNYEDIIDTKCRRRCSTYITEEECVYDTCGWSDQGGTGGTGICFEKICENRIGEPECKAFDEGKNEICGFNRQTETDSTDDDTLFSEWQMWFGLKNNKNADITCIVAATGADKIPAQDIPYDEAYCISEREGNNIGAQYSGRVLDTTQPATSSDYLKTIPSSIQGSHNVNWRLIDGTWTEDFNTLGSAPNENLITTCRNKENIWSDKTVVGDTTAFPGSPGSFYCRKYDYNDNLSLQDGNPCNEDGGDYLSGEGVDIPDGSHPTQTQNRGCQGKDPTVYGLFHLNGASSAAEYCEEISSGNPNNCYLGVPTEDYKFGSDYYEYHPRPEHRGADALRGEGRVANYSFSNSTSEIHGYYNHLRTCNSGAGPQPDCRLLNSYSNRCDSTDSSKCVKGTGTTNNYEFGRCGPETCADLNPELGCQLNFTNDIKKSIEDASVEGGWLAGVYPERWPNAFGAPPPNENQVGWDKGYCVESPGQEGIKTCIPNPHIKSLLTTIKSRIGGEIGTCIVNKVPVSADNAATCTSLGGEWVDNDKPRYNMYYMSIVYIVIALAVLGANYAIINKRENKIPVADRGLHPHRRFNPAPRALGWAVTIGQRPPNLLFNPAAYGAGFDIKTNIFCVILVVMTSLSVIYMIYNVVPINNNCSPEELQGRITGDNGYNDIITKCLEDPDETIGGSGGFDPWSLTVSAWNGRGGDTYLLYLLIGITVVFTIDSGVGLTFQLTPHDGAAPALDGKSFIWFISLSCIIAGFIIVIWYGGPSSDNVTDIRHVGTDYGKPIHDTLEFFGLSSPPKIDIMTLKTCQTYIPNITKLLPGEDASYGEGIFREDYGLLTDSDKRLLFEFKGNWGRVFSIILYILYIIVIVVFLDYIAPVNTGPKMAILLLLCASSIPAAYCSALWVSPSTSGVEETDFASKYFKLDELSFKPLTGTGPTNTCKEVGKFCDTNTFNLDQDNHTQVTVAGDGSVTGPNGDVCIENIEAWTTFVNAMSPPTDDSFPSVDNEIIKNLYSSSYKDSLIKQIKMNSYYEHIKGNNTLLDNSRVELAKKYQGKNISANPTGIWFGLLLWYVLGLILLILIITNKILGGRMLRHAGAAFGNSVNDIGPLLVVLTIGVLVIIWFYSEKFASEKESIWFDIFTKRYNLWEGYDYQYWVNECPAGTDYKCMVKGGDISDNAENSIFEIKLPKGQSHEATKYECEKLNGCLLSDIDGIKGKDGTSPDMDELNQKCPGSGFIEEDITEIINNFDFQNTMPPHCIDNGINIVDKFRVYRGLPGTLDDSPPTFDSNVDADQPPKDGQPDIDWTYLALWIGVFLVAISVMGAFCQLFIGGHAYSVRDARLVWGNGLLARVPIGIIVCLYPVIFMACVYMVGKSTADNINEDILKYNNYMEPSIDVTEDLLALSSNTNRVDPSLSYEQSIINPVLNDFYTNEFFAYFLDLGDWGYVFAVCVFIISPLVSHYIMH